MCMIMTLIKTEICNTKQILINNGVTSRIIYKEISAIRNSHGNSNTEPWIIIIFFLYKSNLTFLKTDERIIIIKEIIGVRTFLAWSCPTKIYYFIITHLRKKKVFNRPMLAVNIHIKKMIVASEKHKVPWFNEHYAGHRLTCHNSSGGPKQHMRGGWPPWVSTLPMLTKNNIISRTFTENNS